MAQPLQIAGTGSGTGRVAIAVRDDDEWKRLARLLGIGPSLARRCMSLEGRQAHETELEAPITRWTQTRSALDVELTLQADNIPAHVAVSSTEFVADPHLAARKHLVRLPRTDGSVSVVEASRFQLSETPGRPGRAAPEYGRDNHAVLRDLLDYSPGQIEMLEGVGALV